MQQRAANTVRLPTLLLAAWAGAAIIGHARADDSAADAPLPLPDMASALRAEPSAVEIGLRQRRLRCEVSVWAWLTGLEGDAAIGDRSADISASFADILDASDMLVAVAGRFEAGYDRFGIFADGFWADISADDQGGPVGFSSVDVSSEIGLLDFGLMYRVLDGGVAADAHPAAMGLTLALQPAFQESRSRHEGWVDPIVGAKLVVPFGDRWHAAVNGDVGGFGVASDLTWSATALVGFDFTIGALPASIVAGYRAVAWDFEDGDGDDLLEWNATLHGPMLGLSIRF
jgi:hypothetical protein